MKSTILAVSLVLCLGTTWARLVPDWPYEKLFAESDLVVIAEPMLCCDSKDVFERPDHSKDDYTGMNSTFEIRSVLKGSPQMKKCSVLHFRYSDKVGAISNGALFVRFRLTGRSFKGLIVPENKEGPPHAGVQVYRSEAKPDYLLFLKRRADGRYEPVSGQYDAALSCREIRDTTLSDFDE